MNFKIMMSEWKRKIKKRIFRSLKIKYWGVGIDIALPVEFVVNQHAYKRLLERTKFDSRKYPEELVKVWYDGVKPPANFDKNKADKRSVRKIYSKFAYKYYQNNVFVFGVIYNNFFVDGQKHLITIYNWNENRNTSKSFVC